MNIKSVMQFNGMSRKLMDYMELANAIPEKDFKTAVKKAQKNKKCIKGIIDNAERGNLFMIAFFLRELVQSVTDE